MIQLCIHTLHFSSVEPWTAEETALYRVQPGLPVRLVHTRRAWGSIERALFWGTSGCGLRWTEGRHSRTCDVKAARHAAPATPTATKHWLLDWSQYNLKDIITFLQPILALFRFIWCLIAAPQVESLILD